MPICRWHGPLVAIHLIMFWGAFHEHFVSRCWEGSFPVLKKALLTSPQCAITGLGLHSQRSLQTSLLVMVQKSIPSCCIFPCLSSIQSLSRVQLCNPMDCRTLGLPVHPQLPELTQTHVYHVRDRSNRLILYCPLLLPPSFFPSIRAFSNESVLHIRWPKYWNFSFSISPSNKYSGLISFRIDWFDPVKK